MYRVAMISVHGCPLAWPGTRDAGGMNVYIRELSRELGRRGALVDVFTRRRSPSVPEVSEFGENVRVIHLKAGPVGETEKNAVYDHLPEFLCNLRLYREEHGLDYDILHSHYWLSGWVAGFVQQRWALPHVTMFHTLGEVKNRARVGERESVLRIETERKIVAQADRVVAASSHEKAQLVQLYGAVPRRVETIPCGVDLGLFQPIDKVLARRQLGLDAQKIVLVVGRIEPLKGVDILIEAVAKLEDRDEVLVLVVGAETNGSKETRRLKGIARQSGIGANVRFLGPVEQTALPAIYSAADVCVVASYYESFGMVAAEAQACGTPVVASRVGGLQTAVKDGETGFLIPWRCPEPFAERLELLLGNDELRSRFGKAARSFIERFRWPAVADSMMALYDDLSERSLKKDIG
ncbi:MAG: glycosyltransferase [Dehalococcoidia bacterium]|nr:glycosyltransferase [Dehalococcoidia bacterium]